MIVFRNRWWLLAIFALVVGCATNQKSCANPRMVLVPSVKGFVYVPTCADPTATGTDASNTAQSVVVKKNLSQKI